jgi:hypothetical protein
MISNFYSALVAALVGRMAKHVILAQSGQRKLFGWHLLLELPVAIFMGFVGSGLAEWLNLSNHAATGLIAALSYLGPSAIEIIIIRWIENRSKDEA